MAALLEEINARGENLGAESDEAKSSIVESHQARSATGTRPHSTACRGAKPAGGPY